MRSCLEAFLLLLRQRFFGIAVFMNGILGSTLDLAWLLVCQLFCIHKQTESISACSAGKPFRITQPFQPETFLTNQKLLHYLRVLLDFQMVLSNSLCLLFVQDVWQLWCLAMASSSRVPQSRDYRVDNSRKVQVTILASEWGSSKGGLSTINRELAIQLAK